MAIATCLVDPRLLPLAEMLLPTTATGTTSATLVALLLSPIKILATLLLKTTVAAATALLPRATLAPLLLLATGGLLLLRATLATALPTTPTTTVLLLVGATTLPTPPLDLLPLPPSRATVSLPSIFSGPTFLPRVTPMRWTATPTLAQLPLLLLSTCLAADRAEKLLDQPTLLTIPTTRVGPLRSMALGRIATILVDLRPFPAATIGERRGITLTDARLRRAWTTAEVDQRVDTVDDLLIGELLLRSRLSDGN